MEETKINTDGIPNLSKMRDKLNLMEKAYAALRRKAANGQFVYSQLTKDEIESLRLYSDEPNVAQILQIIEEEKAIADSLNDEEKPQKCVAIIGGESEAEIPSGNCYQIAKHWNLKEIHTRKTVRFTGANPFDSDGATEDGFTLYSDGSAYDRSLDKTYDSNYIQYQYGLPRESPLLTKQPQVDIIIRSKSGKHNFKEKHRVVDSMPIIMAYLAFAAGSGQGVRVSVLDSDTKEKIMAGETFQASFYNGVDFVEVMKNKTIAERKAILHSGRKL